MSADIINLSDARRARARQFAARDADRYIAYLTNRREQALARGNLNMVAHYNERIARARLGRI